MQLAVRADVAWKVQERCRRCNVAGQCNCLAPDPLPEILPGWNLFWYDPCARQLDGCAPIIEPTGNAPLWYANAELMALVRDQQDEFAFASLGESGTTVLGTGDFQTEFDAGIRVGLGVTLGDWYRFEAIYAGTQKWTDAAAVRNADPNALAGTGNLFSPFSGFGNPAIVGLDYNNFASVAFESTLHNGELNLRRRLETEPNRLGRVETSFLVGVRYLQIEEGLDYHTESSEGAGSVNDIATGVKNKMLGAQVGLLSQFLCRSRLWIDFEVKGVILHNEVGLESRYVNTDGGGGVLTNFNDSDQRERTTFLGDASLTANYHFTRSLTFRLGYNLMWFSGLTQASENLNTNIGILSLGPAQLAHRGDAVYHGPSMGLVWAR